MEENNKMFNFKEKLIKLSNRENDKKIKKEISEIKRNMKIYAELGYYSISLSVYKGDYIKQSILPILEKAFPNFKIKEILEIYGYKYNISWGEENE